MRTRRILTLAIPAAAIAAVDLLSGVSPGASLAILRGRTDLGAALFELIFTFIRASVTRPGLFGTGDGTHRIEFLFLPAVMIFILAVSVRTFDANRSRPLLIPSHVTVRVVELAVAHYLAGINYPVDRVGIYLFLLLGLARATAASQVAVFAVRAVQGALAGLLAASISHAIRDSLFRAVGFDLPAKEVGPRIREDSSGNHPNHSRSVRPGFISRRLSFIATTTASPRSSQSSGTPRRCSKASIITCSISRTMTTSRGAMEAGCPPLYSEPISGVLLAKEPSVKRLPSEREAAIAFASIRTAVCAYRAATQSFVGDEAFTYNQFRRPLMARPVLSVRRQQPCAVLACFRGFR